MWGKFNETSTLAKSIKGILTMVVERSLPYIMPTLMVEIGCTYAHTSLRNLCHAHFCRRLLFGRRTKFIGHNFHAILQFDYQSFIKVINPINKMASVLVSTTSIVALLIVWSLSLSKTEPSIRIAPTVTTTCPSSEDIDSLHANAKLIVESRYNTNRPCSCGGAGWTREAYLNMSDPQQTCPSNWTLNTSPVRGCGRSSTGAQTCDSVVYPVNGRNYSSVCGRIIAYHKHLSVGFPSVWLNITIPIEESYLSGVSITHGLPGARQHVWTFVGAINEQDSDAFNWQGQCPCSNTTAAWAYDVPSFIGSDYFCDTGNRGPGYNFTAFYLNDPLWDGEGCGSTSSCCEFNSPPWFCKFLPQPTTDDLEIRLCNALYELDEDKIISEIDIFVK